MRQKQYLITEAELRAIVAHAQSPDTKVDIEVFDYEMGETSLDVILVDTKADESTLKLSFSEGKPFRPENVTHTVDNPSRPSNIVSFPSSKGDNFPI